MEPNKAAYRTVKVDRAALDPGGDRAGPDRRPASSSQVYWRGLEPGGPAQRAAEIAVYALFIPSGILTLMSAFSFLFMRRKGWLLAAIAQGLSLAVSLWLYSWFQPGYVYPIMAYCVLMILYLNSYDVRVVFLPRRGSGASVEG